MSVSAQHQRLSALSPRSVSALVSSPYSDAQDICICLFSVPSVSSLAVFMVCLYGSFGSLPECHLLSKSSLSFSVASSAHQHEHHHFNASFPFPSLHLYFSVMNTSNRALTTLSNQHIVIRWVGQKQSN